MLVMNDVGQQMEKKNNWLKSFFFHLSLTDEILFSAVLLFSFKIENRITYTYYESWASALKVL